VGYSFSGDFSKGSARLSPNMMQKGESLILEKREALDVES